MATAIELTRKIRYNLSIMKYLAYHQNGFLKKFPLKKKNVTLGRSPENDLVIDDSYLSRVHLRIKVKDNSLAIQDMNSVNGTFYGTKRIDKSKIPLGDSFIVGRTEIGFKEGSVEEFSVTEKYVPLQNKVPGASSSQNKQTQKVNDITDSTCNACRQLLEDILAIGYKKKSLTDFMSHLAARLTELDSFGSLFLAWYPKEEPHILLSVKNHPEAMALFKIVTERYPNLHSSPLRAISLETEDETELFFYTYPLRLNDKNTALIYITAPGHQLDDHQLEKFLFTLSKEIELIAHIYREKEKALEASDPRITIQHKNSTKKEKKAEWTDTNDMEDTGEFPDDMVAVSAVMRRVIQQARRLAGSDLFVLIHGESGTGKELFGRLLHKHSRRGNNKLIALNCAAIPENLLESELFGHEKGAFTGAYTQRMGKLELASGGTLLLDEIGDMPLNLQAKLLRALQEKEFYRLGGTTPIRVDLRIISLTHQNLKELIREKKFREDLYFRLVHRSLTIPPLRERNEDIPVLINYFTNRCCSISGKTVIGYSVKAFEALLNYSWRGNVRELENEINSLVNLTEEGEMIDYDMLSEEIRESVLSAKTPEIKKDIIETPDTPGNIGNQTRPPVGMFYEKPDKDVIMELLEKNRWNKSKTAADLNMTYQGLHKKMIRLGIQAKGSRLKDTI